MPVTSEGFSPEALEANFAQLAANEYPGRLIVNGITGSGDGVQVYTIMGRSTGSQNRVFEKFDDQGSVGVRTAPFEVKPGEDHSLTIYNAMRAAGHDAHVVTNGEQTDHIVEAIREAGGHPADPFLNALKDWGYEPDKPNWTPRINGLFTRIGLSVIEYMKKDNDSHRIIRTVDERTLNVPGVGLCVHTYDGNAPEGEPLPPFSGSPYFIPLGETVAETADMLWSALDADNKVSLAVKALDVNPENIILKNKHLGD